MNLIKKVDYKEKEIEKLTLPEKNTKVCLDIKIMNILRIQGFRCPNKSCLPDGWRTDGQMIWDGQLGPSVAIGKPSLENHT